MTGQEESDRASKSDQFQCLLYAYLYPTSLGARESVLDERYLLNNDNISIKKNNNEVNIYETDFTLICSLI